MKKIKIGNQLVKFGPNTNRVLIGDAKDKEIFLFYKAQPNLVKDDPFKDAINRHYVKQDFQLRMLFINEKGEPIEYSCIYNDSIQEFLLNYFIDVKLKGYSNQYLQQYLTVLYEEKFSVVGNEDILEMCPCCRYLTLTHRGNYDICPLCYWEDDGKSYDELDSYSSVNHTTLGTYRKKFEEKKSELNKIPYRFAII